MERQDLNATLLNFAKQVKVQYGVNFEFTVCNMTVISKIEVTDPVEMLPRSLRRKLRNKKAFRKAYEARLITCDEGVWVNRLGSARRLAYVCGRCFSCDRIVGRRIFKGKHPFPARELETLFGIRDMENPRKDTLDNKIPKVYDTLDFLFDMRP